MLQNAERSRKDRVLCHTLGRVTRMAELQCQKQEFIDHPKTVTVHPFGAYPHLIPLILVWSSRSSFHQHSVKYNVFQLVTFWNIGSM